MQQAHPRQEYGMTLSACLWLGLFPLLQGGTYYHITLDKLHIMQYLSAVTLLCLLFDLVFSLIRRKKDPSVSSGKRQILLPLLIASALMVLTAVSCFSSKGFTSVTWWIGEDARYEGLATQLCYFGLFVCFLFSRVYRRPVVLSASAGVIAYLVVVLLQRAGGNPFGLYPSDKSYELIPEFQGTIGNIDMVTGYLLLMAGFLLYSFLDDLFTLRPSKASSGRSARLKPKGERHFCLSLISLAAFLAAVYLILTMGVQFGVISLSVLLLFTLLRFLPRKARLPLLIILIVVALLVVWFWPGHTGGLWELHEVFHGRARLSFGSNRVAVWYYSILMSKEHLLLGNGSGTFKECFNTFLPEHDYVIPTEQDGLALPDYFDNPHSEYIAQLTDHGLPAMLFFILLLLVSVFRRREGWFPCLSPYSAAVLCYAVQAIFSFSVCLVAPMFWVILALSFTEPK